MKQVKTQICKKLQFGIPLKIPKGHTVLLKTMEDPLTVHTGLSLFYAMPEALEIPRTLDKHIHGKDRERGYQESEDILALAANAFIGGDFLDDLEALREDVALQNAIGRKDIPDPTTAGDFCRQFTLGYILQFNRAMAEIHERVCHLPPKMTAWTIDPDVKAQEVFGSRKRGWREIMMGSTHCRRCIPLSRRRRKCFTVSCAVGKLSRGPRRWPICGG